MDNVFDVFAHGHSRELWAKSRIPRFGYRGVFHFEVHKPALMPELIKFEPGYWQRNAWLLVEVGDRDCLWNPHQASRMAVYLYKLFLRKFRHEQSRKVILRFNDGLPRGPFLLCVHSHHTEDLALNLYNVAGEASALADHLFHRAWQRVEQFRRIREAEHGN